MLCTDLQKVKRVAKKLTVEPLRCKRWSCEHCREKNKRKVIAQATEGNPSTMITLTIRGDFGSIGEQASRLVESWRMVRQRWAREHNGQKIPFIAIFERHPRSGRPHMHILCRAPYIPQRWLSNRMRELAGSPVCDIRAVKGRRQAGRYVAKYIGKDLAAFPGCKRYWRSHDYADLEAGRRDNSAKVEIYAVRDPLRQLFMHWYCGSTFQGYTANNRAVSINFGTGEVWIC